eukprot:scaffold14974_cov195-Amphora_coffeaeformis.AAC.48
MSQPAISQGEEDQGILTSLRHYDAVRLAASDSVVRHEGSNADVFIDPTDGKEIALCHLSTILPFTTGDFDPFRVAFEDAYSIALAIHHLNTGDGSIVPELEGLNERCPVRFTTEFADTEFVGGATLKHVVEQTSREDPTERLPCAFLGAYRSAVSIPMSLVTGLLGYPQLSGASTSAELDDKSQYPLFGRTLPSDAGNAIPLIIYLREILQIQHLVVINVNDAYGNLYVEGMRNARDEWAPDMIIHQIPLDEDSSSIESVVASAKATGFQFIFAIVFTAETHDQLMTAAYQQGIAGDGRHNWVFGDSFLGTLDNRSFEKDSPLHLSYRGVGLLEITGGVAGFPEYDKYVSRMQELKNPTDSAYIGSLVPKHNHPNYPSVPPFISEDNFLAPITNGFSPFVYEAAVALGLSACNAITDDFVLTAEAHVAAVRALSFTSISGTVAFDPATGSRDPSSALYKVANFQEQELEDGTIAFQPIVTNLFQNSEWNWQDEFLFNDGTPNLPPDLAPAGSGDDGNLPILIGCLAGVALVLGVVVFLFYEHKRKSNDSVWQVKKEELKFNDPPEVLGRGSFGMVLLGEYRGTQVAVKRVIPQQTNKASGRTSSTLWGRGTKNTTSDIFDAAAETYHKDKKVTHVVDEDASNSEVGTFSSFTGTTGSWAGMSMSVASGVMSGVGALSMRGKDRKLKKNKKGPTAKQLKEEFMEEMRYLSKLRHPCVTTVMGAMIEKGEDPMLIMEYMDHGSLYDILHNETMPIDGEVLLPILRDISQGVRFLHSADPQCLHGDLKAANILVDNRFRAKVADFGLSQKKNLGGTGTPYWMAPELLRMESTNTSMSDVYSFGGEFPSFCVAITMFPEENRRLTDFPVILYEAYSRSDPYIGEHHREVLRLVADKKVRKRPGVPKNMSIPIQTLMADCLEEESDKRPSFEEIDVRLKRINTDSASPASYSLSKNSQVSLFDIFPRHIAEALRDGRKVEAEHKDCVTIFFSDIVGFTTISSKLDPRKVANLLDRLYHKFDELSEKHDLYKVETIGDAYMAVANLVKDQWGSHCKRVAKFAIEAVKVANETLIDEDDKAKGTVNIRVGFHSGSVVADIVGNRNPRYCLFG